MPVIRRRVLPLADMFVFYERLGDDEGWSPEVLEEHRALMYEAWSGFSKVSSEVAGIIQSGAVLRAMGEAEAAKEKKLLKAIFGQEVQIDFNDDSSVKNFIDVLNSCIGLREVYERNKFLIKNSKGMKSVISYFPTYFMKVWNEAWSKGDNSLSAEIDAAVGKKRKAENILTAIRSVLEPKLEAMIPEAIRRMLEAEPELRKQMPPEMKNAYQELVKAIGEVQQQGSLAQQISEIYQLDQLSQVLTEAILNKQTTAKQAEAISKKVKGNFAQRGGLSLEAIENTVFSMIADGVKEGVKEKGSVYYSGKKETGFKADNILSFGIDADVIQQALETNEAVSRERNKQLFENLEKNLKGIKDGYIVYSSDKNYTYNEGFKERGGFKAEGISLDTYRNIMKYTTRNARTFVGAILQTAEGAIKGPQYRPQLEEAMAQDIAYFLFDDFKTLGKEAKAGDPTAIHIMNLDGIYLPLSFFLILVARAIEEEVGNPDDFVRVNVNIPSILWKTREEQEKWQERNGSSAMDAWVHQKEEALAESKIEVHFLKEFQQIIRDYL